MTPDPKHCSQYWLEEIWDMNHPVAEEARLNALVHQTSCNFKKVPGHTYFVYKQRKHPDKEFISMISPQVHMVPVSLQVPSSSM
jgi:hypothetical protein